jgi:TPR repeat protein
MELMGSPTMNARSRWGAIGLAVAIVLTSSASRANSLTAGARAYADEHYNRSARLLLPRAERGDPLAQTYVGIMYLRGEGVPQNFELAVYWLRFAANAGVPTAQYFLGDLYNKGQGVPTDWVLSEAWLILAVSHADPYWRSRWVLIRDAVASKMSRHDVDEAQQLALTFQVERMR